MRLNPGADTAFALIRHPKYVCWTLQVNKIRDLGMADHKHIVVTHTDAKETYVWNMDTQPAHQKGPKVLLQSLSKHSLLRLSGGFHCVWLGC